MTTAERIAALGGSPCGTPGALVSQRDWDDYSIGRADTLEHLGALDVVYAGIIEAQRRAVDASEDLDPVTQDLLIAQSAQLEQFHWFVRAHLEGSDGSLSLATISFTSMRPGLGPETRVQGTTGSDQQEEKPMADAFKMATKTTRRTEQDLLGVYLNDHLAGATVGVGLARRMAASAEPGSESAAVIKPLVSEIAADRSALVTMMAAVGVKVRGYKVLAAWAGEKAGLSRS